MNRRKRARVVGSGFLGLAVVASVSYAAAATPLDESVPVTMASIGSPLALADVDAGDTADAGTAAPTWSTLYRKYMAKETPGDCASCHAEAATAQQAYTWLAGQEYMHGSPPYLIDPRVSCFSWLGGDMPPEGPSSYPHAKRDFDAWAAAGASSE